MKILAIDIGTAQIKVILFERRFTKFDILQYEVVEVDKFSDSHISAATNSFFTTAQTHALETIWKNYSNIFDSIVMNMPINMYTSRILKFPFKSIKKIEQSAKFQIEDEVPLDPEKCIITNKIFSNQTENSITISHCSLALKETVKKFLSELYDATRIEPNVLTTVQDSFSSVLEKVVNISTDEKVALMEFGHQNSAIHIYKNAIPIISRTLPFAGYHITAAIAEAFKLNMAEAELLKIQKASLPNSKQKSEEKLLSDLVNSTLEPVFFNFNQCIMALFSRNQSILDKIYLCGGTSALPGMKEYISLRWNTEAKILNINQHLPSISIQPPPHTEHILTQAISLGMTQVVKGANRTPNFRIGKLRAMDTIPLNMKAYSKFIQLIVIVYSIAIFSFGVQTIVLSSQIKTLSSLRDSSIRKVLGKLSSGVLYKLKNNPREIKKRTDRKLEELRSKVGTLSKKSSFFTLNLLKDISENIPNENVIEINLINITKKKIKLKFNSPDKKSAKTTLNYIKDLNFVKKVENPVQKKIDSNQLSSYVEIKLKKDIDKL